MGVGGGGGGARIGASDSVCLRNWDEEGSCDLAKVTDLVGSGAKIPPQVADFNLFKYFTGLDDEEVIVKPSLVTW